jgi:DNA-binding beta-propeller fold protein YncE
LTLFSLLVCHAVCDLHYESGFTGQFSPRGLTMDHNNNIIVADPINNKIKTFTASGTLIGQFGNYGFGLTDIFEPMAVAVDATGNILATDGSGNHRIQVFFPNGTHIRSIGKGLLSFPWDVKVEPSGTILVAERSGNLRRFAANGTYLSKLVGPGSANGQVGQAYGVTFDRVGSIYLSDFLYHRFQKFAPDGTWLYTVGGPTSGTANGKFNGAWGIAIDNSDRLYVCDYGNKRVQVFAAADGAYVGKYEYQIAKPIGVVFSEQLSKVFVSDEQNQRIQVLSSACV